jgi:hypothetical protein
MAIFKKIFRRSSRNSTAGYQYDGEQVAGKVWLSLHTATLIHTKRLTTDRHQRINNLHILRILPPIQHTSLQGTGIRQDRIRRLLNYRRHRLMTTSVAIRLHHGPHTPVLLGANSSFQRYLLKTAHTAQSHAAEG